MLGRFNAYLDSLEQQLLHFERIAATLPEDSLKAYFTRSRLLYKHIEFLVEYNYPEAATRMNGASLLEAEAAEPEEPTHPTGFQVLEETVYEPATAESRLVMANEINGITAQVRKVRIYAASLDMSEAEVMDALKLNLYRMVAKSLSAFDCPSAQSGIMEAAEILRSMREVLSFYGMTDELSLRLEKAAAYATANGHDFNGFDRAIFLSEYMQPVFREFQVFARSRGIASIAGTRAVHTDAASFLDDGAFNTLFFAPTGTAPETPVLVALGKQLFHEPLISGNGARSCGGCHEPSKAFTDGKALNTSLFGDKQLLRNTPTLLNAALQPAQFADSRIAFLEDQVHAVVSNKQEMDGDFNRILSRLEKNKVYTRQFTEAFPGTKPMTKANVRKAIAAYVRSLTSLNARFDQYMRGNRQAMNAQEVRGFNLYMGKAKCGTCHYVPLFNGAVPPLYDKIESEVLGVPATTDTLHARVDPDPGKYELYKMPHQKHSFKTPTLRNIALTAPYMHNGVYQTLEEVIDFYNKGGGAGLGYELPNQTLAPDRLELTETDKKDLVAFLQTLTDTAVAK